MRAPAHVECNRKHPTALAHTFHDSDVVLTGSTEDIQAFVRAHANTFSHPEGAVIRSGVFTINKDGTCSSKTTFSIPSGADASREVSASYTREGSRLTMTWTGAGTTIGTVEGNTFAMDNEGMVLAYRK